MMQFPRWRVDVTVGGDLVKTLYETATTPAAAIAKAKHKLRGAVSSAGAFKFKASKVEAGEPEHRHATKKSPAKKLQIGGTAIYVGTSLGPPVSIRTGDRVRIIRIIGTAARIIPATVPATSKKAMLTAFERGGVGVNTDFLIPE